MARVPSLTLAAKQDVLAGAALFAGLPGHEVELLAGLAREWRVVRDTVVVRRGDPGDSLLLVVTGRLRAGAVSPDGREVTHGLVEPGMVVGEIALLDGQARSLDVTAMIDSVLLVLERAPFLAFLLARPELMLRLMGVLCARLRRSSTALEEVALSPLPNRLARLLLRQAQEHGQVVPEGVRIRLRLSQRELSAQVAATRESVNKVLRLWREQGWVGDMDGDLVVRRPEALRALSAAHGP